MKKNRSKIISFIMALVMALSLLPTAAFAASITATVETSQSVGGYVEGNAYGTVSMSNGLTNAHWMCMEPEGNPPAVGHKFSVQEATGLYRVFAWMAQNTSDQHRLWNIHHAVSELNGTNNGVFYAEQQAVYKEAQNYDTSKIPANFKAYIGTPTTASSDQISLIWGYEPTGNLTLIKTSSNTAITSGNSNYSLAGAVYGVYKNSDCSGKVGSLTTKADGTTNTLTDLNAGWYYAKETSAPDGFKIDTKVHSIEVKAGQVNKLTVSDEPETGKLTIVKSSANSSITNDNNCYSLTGAEYTVYAEKACTTKVGVCTIKADGTSNTLSGLAFQSYYAKETKAPKGYALDKTVYSITVDGTSLTTLNVSDKPGSDPVNILLQKIDAATGKASPMGNGSLAGAEFTFRYYDGQYETAADAEASGKPTRTWVFKTDEDGEIYFAASYKVSGDALFENSVGPTIPYGTLLIQETKAPKGYLLNDYVYVRHIRDDGSHAEIVDSYSVPEVKETIIHGGVQITKLDSDLNKAQAQGSATLEGAKYAIINKSEHSVKVGETVYKSGSTVATLTTDAKGVASTAANLLPYGDYEIVEKTAPNGYKLEGETVATFSIKENGKMVKISDKLKDEVERGGVKVQKNDLETGAAAQGDATLEGAKFAIISLNTNPVVVEGKTYKNGETVKTLTTNAKGYVATAADLLPVGDYKLVETKAPEGYLLEGGVTEATFSITKDGQMVDMTATMSDPVVKGKIEIIKHTDTGITKIETPEVGAKFEVYLKSAGSFDAAPENARDLLTINLFGKATTKDLPYGIYTVHQIDGWKGSAFIENFDVVIHADNGGEPYTYIINNERFYAYLKIVKTDALTGEAIPVEGVGFQIFTPAGELVEFWGADTWYSDAEGIVKVPTDLEYGEGYKAVEVSAPDGYLLATEPFMFDVLEENASEEDGLTVITLRAPNTPTTVQIDKVDPYGNPVVGAKLQVLNANGTVVDEWLSDGTGHIIHKMSIGGKYTLREVAAPEGMVLASDVTFTVEDTADTQYVTMTDKTVTVTKEDMGGKEVPGADMSITDKDGKVVDKWTSTEESHAISGLVAGETYVLHEVAAPDGYVKATDIEFTVTDDGIDQALSMIDKIVTVEKLDPYGNPVEGAALELFDSKNVIVDKWVSDGTAHAAIGLIAGEKYTLRETSAPDGWMLADDVTFTVTDDGKDQVVKMEDMEIPEIHTTATVNGEHVALATKDMTLTDVIEHIKLVVGREYRVVTVAMDKTTKEAALDHGKKITSEMTYTATVADGSVDAVLNFDGTELAGHDIVVFEYFYLNGKLVVSHENWDDEGQTVVIPGIHTKATVDGKHEVVAKGPVTIDERVELLPNMPVGVPLTFQASAKDQETGNSILDKNGNPVVATKVVTLTGKETEVPVPVKIEDASLLAGKTVVMFERVTMEGKDGKQILIATHEDLNSADQSVHFEEPIGKITVTDQPGTGDAGIMAYAAMGGISALGGLALLINRKRRKDEEA